MIEGADLEFVRTRILALAKKRTYTCACPEICWCVQGNVSVIHND